MQDSDFYIPQIFLLITMIYASIIIQVEGSETENDKIKEDSSNVEEEKFTNIEVVLLLLMAKTIASYIIAVIRFIK